MTCTLWRMSSQCSKTVAERLLARGFGQTFSIELSSRAQGGNLRSLVSSGKFSFLAKRHRVSSRSIQHEVLNQPCLDL